MAFSLGVQWTTLAEDSFSWPDHYGQGSSTLAFRPLCSSCVKNVAITLVILRQIAFAFIFSCETGAGHVILRICYDIMLTLKIIPRPHN
jgi:hypothetical protein